jgi:DNA sulfur modification protein DndC
MITSQIQDLIERGALFVVNHSGGKDSQAMYLKLRDIVPAAQMVHVHADLGAVEWAGAYAHILATTGGERLLVCNAKRDLLQMIEGPWHVPLAHPAPVHQRPEARPHRAHHPRPGRRAQGARRAGWNLVVNCMGMRAEESSSRAKLTTFKLSARNSIAGREWYDWLPIHDMLETEVFATIAAAGQQPHPVYAKGMSRFSCCFCIMASQKDLTTAAQLSVTNPELFNDPTVYAQYVGLERSTGQVMLMPSKTHGRRTLEEVTGVYIGGEQPARKVIPIAVAAESPALGDCGDEWARELTGDLFEEA